MLSTSCRKGPAARTHALTHATSSCLSYGYTRATPTHRHHLTPRTDVEMADMKLWGLHVHAFTSSVTQANYKCPTERNLNVIIQRHRCIGLVHLQAMYSSYRVVRIGPPIPVVYACRALPKNIDIEKTLNSPLN